jgi:hypothetical protein
MQEKLSALQREHAFLQNMKFIHFFLILLVNFVLLDPDSDSKSGSGSTNSIESGSTALENNFGFIFSLKSQDLN